MLEPPHALASERGRMPPAAVPQARTASGGVRGRGRPRHAGLGERDESVSVMGSPPEAGLVSLAIAGGLFVLGYLLASLVLHGARFDGIDRAALALPGFVVWALVVMLAHIASGGAVLSHRWVTVGAVIAPGLGLAAWRLRSSSPLRAPMRWRLAAIATVVAALAVWGSCVFFTYPLAHNGDTMSHMGWATQLLDGASVPTAMITGAIPNYYPWMYHATVALIADLMPGGRAYSALGPLQLLTVAGMALGLFALGRRVVSTRAGAVATALFGCVSGGFGFLLDRGFELAKASRGRFFGDLLVTRPYNISFDNLPSPQPRDLTFALLPAAILLLIAGIRRDDRKLLIGSGVVIGLLGLTGLEAFVVAGATAILAALLATPHRLRTLANVIVPAVLVYLLWLGPVAYNYVRLGGFVNTTKVGNEALSAADILFSWGVVTPLAALGAWVLVPRSRRRAYRRVPWLLLAASGMLVIVSDLAFRSGLGAFSAAGKPHRYWPLFFLALAPFAGTGFAALRRACARHGRIAGAAASSVILVATLGSPVVAAVAADRGPSSTPVLTQALEGTDGLLNDIAPRPGRACRIAVPRVDDFLVFSYTGYKQVFFAWARLHHNRARVRWRDIYSSVPDDRIRMRANRILTRGVGPPKRWRRIARRYGVDVVVAPVTRLRSPIFRRLPHEVALGPDGRSYVVVYRRPWSDCSA